MKLKDRFKDIIGCRINKLTIIKHEGKNKHGSHQYLCKCDCENEKIIAYGSLTRKNPIKSCGCLIKEINKKRCFKSLVGKKFGKLKVLKRMQNGKKNTVRYLCECDCGNEKIIAYGSLTRKDKFSTKSCGCLIKKNKFYKPYIPVPKNNSRKDSYGYVRLYKPNHNYLNYESKSQSRWIGEHISAMSEYLQRPIQKGEQIHHKNGIRNDNRIENLELWSKSHPSGQRVKDVIDFCRWYLEKYEAEYDKLK